VSGDLVTFSPRLQTALSFLSAARQADPDPETAVVYMTALSDISDDAIERACHELAKRPRKDFEPALPTVGTIRETALALQQADADLAARAKLLPWPSKAQPDEPTFFCVQCFDEPNGFRVFACPGVGDQRDATMGLAPDRHPCGRPKSHRPHTYSERCGCVDTNPVIRAHRERARAAQRLRQADKGKHS
jgi:hypothetical protein